MCLLAPPGSPQLTWQQGSAQRLARWGAGGSRLRAALALLTNRRDAGKDQMFPSNSMESALIVTEMQKHPTDKVRQDR